jgi:PilZ domain
MTFTFAGEQLTDTPLCDQAVMHTSQERRRSRRVPLHWTLYLMLGENGHPFRTKTRDISSKGFYCHLDRPARPGDEFECNIAIPTHNSRDSNDVVYLRCRVKTVRVEEIAAGSEYGLACRIEDYYLLRSGDECLTGHTAEGLVVARLGEQIQSTP